VTCCDEKRFYPFLVREVAAAMPSSPIEALLRHLPGQAQPGKSTPACSLVRKPHSLRTIWFVGFVPLLTIGW